MSSRDFTKEGEWCGFCPKNKANIGCEVQGCALLDE